MIHMESFGQLRRFCSYSMAIEKEMGNGKRLRMGVTNIFLTPPPPGGGGKNIFFPPPPPFFFFFFFFGGGVGKNSRQLHFN